jgi:hypothetical protein
MCIIFESWSINLIVRVDSYVPCPFWFSKDLQEQSLWSDRLLTHYFQTFSDRQVYWTARERAKTFGDMLVVIIDSYDKCKVTLPRWAFGRTPKNRSTRECIANWLHMTAVLFQQIHPSKHVQYIRIPVSKKCFLAYVIS